MYNLKNAKVKGEVILDTLEASGIFKRRANKVLEKHNLYDVQTNQWYDLDKCVSYLKELQELFGPNTMKIIGDKVISNKKFPKQIKTLEDALTSLDKVYKSNHRGSNIGKYEYHNLTEKHYTISSTTPYSDAFDQGLILGLTKSFSNGKRYKVEIDKTKASREQGNSFTLYNILQKV